MVKENEFEFNTLNIPQWHNAGYKGKNVKIAVLENDDKKHLKNVINVLKLIAPEAEIITFEKSLMSSVNGHCPNFTEAIDKCIELDVDIITNSYDFSANKERIDALNKAIDNGIILNMASGNDSKDVPDKFVKYHVDRAYLIGASVECAKGKIELTSYSNTGEKVDLNMFTNITLTDGTVFTGTSCATPFLSAIEALLLGKLKEEGYDKSILMDMVYSNLKDLGAIGKDNKYGNGMFILPDIEKLEVNVVNKPEILVIHHTATATGTFEAIKKYHMETKGWNDIGYHYYITKDGVAHKGRAEETIGSHTVGWNAKSLGICLEGNFDTEVPKEIQLNALRKLIKEIYSRRGRLPIHYHNEYADKSCPGKFFYDKFRLQNEVDKVEEVKTNVNVEPHWAEKYFTELNNNGIIISEKRFDDKVTRGELFALLSRILTKLGSDK